MKKLILLLILFISCQSNAQCEITFEDIIKNCLKNSSDFDTFALNHNFSLDTTDKVYFCDYNIQLPTVLRRLSNGNLVTIQYSTYSKTSYLELKNGIQKMGLKYDGTQNAGNMVMYEYSLNDIWIRLAVETKEFDTNYIMTMRITLQ